MAFRKYEEYSDAGELIFSNLSQKPRSIQGRWFAMHNGKIDKFIFGEKSLVSVKILVLLGSKMILDHPYIKITKAKIASIIGHSVKQVWLALKELEKQRIVLETQVDGQTAFIINPAYISKGSKARLYHIEEWKALTETGEPNMSDEEGKIIKGSKRIDKETGEVISDETA